MYDNQVLRVRANAKELVDVTFGCVNYHKLRDFVYGSLGFSRITFKTEAKGVIFTEYD
jgi:hypothetical protein